MEDVGIANASVLETNVTLEQIASALNLTIIVSNATNVTGAVTPDKLFSLYEAYRTREKEQLMLYKSVAYVLGTLIILSNLTVVISSGLILRKGQQPKSTYLLLGNVSLADTIVGISLIFGTIVDNTVNSNVLCLFQIGAYHNLHGPLCECSTSDVLCEQTAHHILWECPLWQNERKLMIESTSAISGVIYYSDLVATTGMIVCPTMVSIFSVGLIAIDRYIYIIHGLYYQRWINTTRVRIGILIIWMIGLSFSLMPATGWINQELKDTRCSYISLFPGELVFINSLISLIPIILVAILYTRILIRALKNITKIKSPEKNIGETGLEKPKLRVYRGNMVNVHNSVKFLEKDNPLALKRSASMSALQCIKKAEKQKKEVSEKSKSTEKINFNSESGKRKLFESKLSIWTIDSDYNTGSSPSMSTSSTPNSPNKMREMGNRLTKSVTCVMKSNEPCKLRAIMVVLLTSGSFIVTWLPFFICAIFYIFCKNKLENPKCFDLQDLLSGSLATLAFVNSVLNPLIYAWWHKGFKNAVKSYVLKHYCGKKS